MNNTQKLQYAMEKAARSRLDRGKQVFRGIWDDVAASTPPPKRPRPRLSGKQRVALGTAATLGGGRVLNKTLDNTKRTIQQEHVAPMLADPEQFSDLLDHGRQVYRDFDFVSSPEERLQEWQGSFDSPNYGKPLSAGGVVGNNLTTLGGLLGNKQEDMNRRVRGSVRQQFEQALSDKVQGMNWFERLMAYLFPGYADKQLESQFDKQLQQQHQLFRKPPSS